MTAPRDTRLAHSWLLSIGAVGALVVLAGVFWVRAELNALQGPEDAITITACLPATVDPEDETDADCVPLATQGFVPFDDFVEGFMVAGRVCNVSDEPAAYTVDMDWVPLDPGAPNFPALDNVAVTYPPGCQAPYGVDGAVNPVFKPSELLASFVEDQLEADGTVQWKLTGLFSPVDPDRHRPLAWDPIPLFTVTAGGSASADR